MADPLSMPVKRVVERKRTFPGDPAQNYVEVETSSGDMPHSFGLEGPNAKGLYSYTAKVYVTAPDEILTALAPGGYFDRLDRLVRSRFDLAPSTLVNVR